MKVPGAALVLMALVLALTMAARVSTSPGPRAREIRGGHWIHSPPLAPDQLHGRVLLVEFWTFGCVNCVRTIPAMQALHAALPDSEVTIVAVHTPEFDHEKGPRNVERAATRLGVRYPILVDDDGTVWRAFGNRYWPALYVVDRRGFIRHVHIGELHRDTADWEALIGLIERLRREPA